MRTTITGVIAFSVAENRPPETHTHTYGVFDEPEKPCAGALTSIYPALYINPRAPLAAAPPRHVLPISTVVAV